MPLLAVLVLALALTGFTYLWLERLDRKAWVPMVFRAVAWTALGLLLLDLSCPVPPSVARPLVLLDGSLSMAAAGGRWSEARDSALRLGEVRMFGDEQASRDTTPSRGRSLLGAGLLAGSAAGRAVIVVTDGEIEDGPDLPPDLLAQAGVRIFPREAVSDAAVTSVVGPSRIAQGDSVKLVIEFGAYGPGPDSTRVEVRTDHRVLAQQRVLLARGGLTRLSIALTPGTLSPGDHLLKVSLAGTEDAEPRDDARLHLLTVTPTPGVVILASPADWDGTFLYRTLRDVAQLPVRGFTRLDAGSWRSMTDLAPVSIEVVRQAARGADLLVVKGDAGGFAAGSRARGVWRWPSGESGETSSAGDWYLSAPGASPIAGALIGAPVDSFPPAVQVLPLQPGPRDWVGLVAREGRRGAARPVVIGWDSGGVRQLIVAADGLWRWGFRGGSSEQGYRAWVAAAASWLLGAADPSRGHALPVRPVVPNARPLVFEWAAAGTPAPLGVSLDGPGGARRDTLRFDGAGRAELRLPAGEYRYRLDGGGSGTLAVEVYSDEWLPRPVTLRERAAVQARSAGRSNARQWIWLFGLCVAALAGEWWGRRRLGLR